MTEFLDPGLCHSMIPIQAFQWILIVHRKVLRRVTHLYERKKRH